MPIKPGVPVQRHWEVLEEPSATNPWRELRDELTGAGTCTHLNDLFRSLADLEAMASPHLRPLDGGARVTQSGDDSERRRAADPA